MMLPLGQVTVLVGAGIIGSVLAQEGRLSKFSDFFSGAVKIAFKHIQQDDSRSAGPGKPKEDDLLLLSQVNSLRHELQRLASSRSVTIITESKSGVTTFGMPIVIIGFVGYGYIWWKGWKLSDMMFATRRSLSDACATVAKQLEQVHSSLSLAKKHLSSRIDCVDKNLDECKQLTVDTRDEVTLLRGDLNVIGVDVQSVHRVFQTLETRIGQIEGKQDLTNQGVIHLCEFVQTLELEQGRQAERIQASPASSSRPAIELPKTNPSSMTKASPTSVLALEQPSPSASIQNLKFSRPFRAASSASGLKELQEISSAIKAADSRVPDGSPVAESITDGSSSSGRSGWPHPSAAFLSRTHSATSYFR